MSVLKLNIYIYLAIALLVSLLSTKVMQKLKLPNVTGYLVFGLLLGPYVLNILSQEIVSQFAIIPDIALGFIAFSIGAEFKYSYLKKVGKTPIIIAILEGLGAAISVILILVFLGYDPALSIVLGAIAAATAPAATLMVVRQYNAKGPVTSTLLPVVALDDMVAIVVFGIAVAAAKAINSPESVSLLATIAGPVIEIVGALVVGGFWGVILKLLIDRFTDSGLRLAAAIGMILLCTGAAMLIGASPLLANMIMSAFFVNLSAQSDQVLAQVDQFTPPIFMLFFFVSGANLDITILPSVGLIGLLYIVFRVLGKFVGCLVGAILTDAEPAVKKYLGFTLIPQAGVAIGLAALSMRVLPEYGPQIQTIVLCATAIYELIGPVITKMALQKAGEIAPAQAA